MEKLDVGKLQEDKIVNGLRPGLSKGDLFADGEFIYKIKAVNENGTYFSEREDLENTVFADEEIVSTEQVLNTEADSEAKTELLPDASKDQQEENENQEPENVDLETLSFKELKEKAISLGFHFKVGQGKEKLIEYIESVSKN